ncbi:hypothetical protein ACQSFK_25620 [Salmonella enterica]
MFLDFQLLNVCGLIPEEQLDTIMQELLAMSDSVVVSLAAGK